MNGLISVIVPVYNTEKYLRKCIESILSQSYKNIELLLINDDLPILLLKYAENIYIKINVVIISKKKMVDYLMQEIME